MTIFKRIGAAVGLGIAFAFAPMAAQAQFVNPRIATLATNLVVWTNNSVLSVGSKTNLFNTFAFTHGLPVETTITTTNNVGPATYTNYFDLCMDATLTNFTTTQPITTTATGTNGTTLVRSVTIIPASSLDGCSAIMLTKIGTSATNFTSVTVRIGVTP